MSCTRMTVGRGARAGPRRWDREGESPAEGAVDAKAQGQEELGARGAVRAEVGRGVGRGRLSSALLPWPTTAGAGASRP